MADPTFVELADVLASGDITDLQVNGSITADSAEINNGNIQAIEIQSSMSFPQTAGELPDHSLVVLRDDGYIGFDPPLPETWSEFVDISDSTDHTVTTSETVWMSSTTTDSFNPATENGQYRLLALVRNTANSSRDFTVQLYEGGAARGSLMIQIGRQSDQTISLTDDLLNDWSNGSAVEVRVTVNTATLTILGTTYTSRFTMEKKSQT